MRRRLALWLLRDEPEVVVVNKVDYTNAVDHLRRATKFAIKSKRDAKIESEVAFVGGLLVRARAHPFGERAKLNS